jgi:hypothetical protein
VQWVRRIFAARWVNTYIAAGFAYKEAHRAKALAVADFAWRFAVRRGHGKIG